mgnify:CR=1 FL=1
MDVFGGHQRDALQRTQNITLGRKLLLKLPEQRSSLVRRDRGNECRIVNLRYHESLSSEPRGDREYDFVREVDAIGRFQAIPRLLGDQVNNWPMTGGRTFTCREQPVVGGIQVGDRDAG